MLAVLATTAYVGIICASYRKDFFSNPCQDITTRREVRGNKKGKNEDGVAGPSQTQLRSYRENAGTTLFQVTRVPFFL